MRPEAENWITAIIAKKGNWGGSETAEVADVLEFKRGSKQVGYFFRVIPQGFIIISLRRDLAPVKAYSASSNLDPQSEEGLADLLKGNMEKLLTRMQVLEQKRQSQSYTTEAQLSEVEVDYRPTWDLLESNVEGFMRKAPKEVPPEDKTMPNEELGSEGELDAETGGETANYVEGNTLLTSHWHQFAPYNNNCPLSGCISPSNGRALVGCVATAGAQIMRYWNWPPYGVGGIYADTYDWRNMPDTATTSSVAAVQAAVAELSREVGVAVGMNYGCSDPDEGSWSNTYDMEGVFQSTYRYSNVSRRNRDDYTAIGWFDLLKDEFNWNRPVQYKITKHSIVGDGWQEIGATPVRQYHMVYGWRNAGNDTWYTLDTLTTDPTGEEYLLENIRPSPYLLDMDGTYSRDATFSYRYFYRDTWGTTGGTFAGGQRIQFLPRILVYNNSSTGTTVTFQGSSSYFSYLFTRGDLNRGIKIHLNSSTAVKLYPKGGIKFH